MATSDDRNDDYAAGPSRNSPVGRSGPRGSPGRNRRNTGAGPANDSTGAGPRDTDSAAAGSERPDSQGIGPGTDAAASASGESGTQKPKRVMMSSAFTPAAEAEASTDADGADEAEQHGLRARPYVLTKGRTQARDDLAIETLISADPKAPWNRNLGPQYQAIRRLCARPASVAEIAATLSVPLGVARVLISDLADTGFVHVHTAPAPSPSGRPDRSLMDRVLAGLQRL